MFLERQTFEWRFVPYAELEEISYLLNFTSNLA